MSIHDLERFARQWWVWLAVGGALLYPVCVVLGLSLGTISANGRVARMRADLLQLQKQLGEVDADRQRLAKQLKLTEQAAKGADALIVQLRAKSETPIQVKPAPIADRPPPSERPLEKTDYDPTFMLDRLREAVSKLGPAWSIAPSPVTWSTFTVSFTDPFSDSTAAAVWTKWTEPVTALTVQANQEIRSEIEQAVSQAGPDEGPVVREFDSSGFRFVVRANNGTAADTRFVQISFMGAMYAEPKS